MNFLKFTPTAGMNQKQLVCELGTEMSRPTLLRVQAKGVPNLPKGKIQLNMTEHIANFQYKPVFVFLHCINIPCGLGHCSACANISYTSDQLIN